MSSVHRFGEQLPYQSPRELDELQEEFTMHQLLHEKEVPKEVWDKAMVRVDDKKSYHRMDTIWNFLSKKNYHRVIVLQKIMRYFKKLILVLPHSNAEEERLFSISQKK